VDLLAIKVNEDESGPVIRPSGEADMTAVARLNDVLSAHAPVVPAMLDQRFDAASLADLRRQVVACAKTAGMPDSRALDVMLVVHELAANAILHGAGSGRLEMLATDGVMRCRVLDGGRHGLGGQPPALAQHWPIRRGHGLWLVSKAADQLDVSSGPGGSEVTVVFGLPASGPGPWTKGAARGDRR
jgi:anti-sigma regulatory factor (Ser/Thr protein kinase)